VKPEANARSSEHELDEIGRFVRTTRGSLTWTKLMLSMLGRTQSQRASKRFSAGQGRLYVNECCGRHSAATIAQVTRKARNVAEGLTIPVLLAGKLLDLLTNADNPRFTLVDAFQRASREGTPIVATNVDTTRKSIGDVKRTNYHEEWHRQHGLLMATSGGLHLDDASVIVFFRMTPPPLEPRSSETIPASPPNA
jgi:hypothetical protein